MVEIPGVWPMSLGHLLKSWHLCTTSSSTIQLADEAKPFSVETLHADVLRKRQKTLMNRVNFAWKVLQDNQSEANQSEATDTPAKQSAGLVHWKAAARKVIHNASLEKQTLSWSLIFLLRGKLKPRIIRGYSQYYYTCNSSMK